MLSGAGSRSYWAWEVPFCGTIPRDFALEAKKHKHDEIDGKVSVEYRTSWNSVFDIIDQGPEVHHDEYKNERLRKRILERFRAKNIIRIENDANPDEIIFTPRPQSIN